MTQDRSLEILKQAILLETRGKAFYQNIADQAQDAKVKEFFDFMAQEEKEHIRILGLQYKAYITDGTFKAGTFDKEALSQVPSKILDADTRNKIAAASVEAAAIGAAILMEQRAVDVYSRQSSETMDPEEKALYAWLSDWEREHLNMLMAIDRDLMDSVWQDNSFWPM